MAFKLNHLHLKTEDPEGAVKFYVDVFGASVSGKNTYGYRLDLHGLPLNVTALQPEEAREQKLGMEHIAINSDEYDKVLAMLKARGTKILEETASKSGKRVCFFEAPDGVQIEFIETKP